MDDRCFQSFMFEAPLNPSYQIRESKRAKYVNIRVFPNGKVEIVVPINFDHSQLPSILEQRQAWIDRTVQRIQMERQTLTLEQPEDWPSHLNLRSLDQTWTITYKLSSHSDRDRLRVQRIGEQQLGIFGVSDRDLCYEGLRQWLRQYATANITPWVRQLSKEIGLPCQRISFRGQRTRWGSCSSKKNLSLNYKLLFLPPYLVRAVLVHELSHTVEMNHSPRFWAQVARHDPDYKQHDAELDTAWRYIPSWIDANA